MAQQVPHTALIGELNIRVGVGYIDSDRQELWSERLDAGALSS